MDSFRKEYKNNANTPVQFTTDPESMEMEKRYLVFRVIGSANDDRCAYSVMVEYDYKNGIWKEKFVNLNDLRSRV